MFTSIQDSRVRKALLLVAYSNNIDIFKAALARLGELCTELGEVENFDFYLVRALRNAFSVSGFEYWETRAAAAKELAPHLKSLCASETVHGDNVKEILSLFNKFLGEEIPEGDVASKTNNISVLVEVIGALGIISNNSEGVDPILEVVKKWPETEFRVITAGVEALKSEIAKNAYVREWIVSIAGSRDSGVSELTSATIKAHYDAPTLLEALQKALDEEPDNICDVAKAAARSIGRIKPDADRLVESVCT